jgi:hypothetical protein
MKEWCHTFKKSIPQVSLQFLNEKILPEILKFAKLTYTFIYRITATFVISGIAKVVNLLSSSF